MYIRFNILCAALLSIISVMILGCDSTGTEPSPTDTTDTSDEIEVYFKEEFKEELTGDAQPRWSWDIRSEVTKGMMVGAGDIYQQVDGEAFLSHGQSLRMNFTGRNGFCNRCGGDDYAISKIKDSEACFTSTKVDHSDFVYNKSNSFSTWNVSSQTGDMICVDISSPKDSAILGQKSSLSVGDKVHLPNLCGVNGSVGRDVDRRSDCNKAINYLENLEAGDLEYGETLARRFHLYIPSEAVLPNRTLKLGYTKWQRPGESYRNATLKLSVQRNMTLELTMPNGEKYARAANSQTAFKMPRDQWVYFEEVFKRESEAGAQDAVYTLYVGEMENPSSEPIVEADDFELGVLKAISIGGNWQHTNDVSGHIYFDNILVADSLAE